METTTTASTTNTTSCFIPTSHRDGIVDAMQLFEQNDGLLLHVMSFLKVQTLCKTKSVNKTWNKLCMKAIRNKLPKTGPKAFQSKDELTDAVKEYCKYESEVMEEFACTYGYPIDKWDVSQVRDFSCVFRDRSNFNEPIGSWDTSKATNMFGMFYGASSFNQPLGSWDTSNVTDMMYMFYKASSFNQPIESLDFSNVTDMRDMLRGASSYNQSLRSWSPYSLNMLGLFKGAYPM